jgi:hypothetical protein
MHLSAFGKHCNKLLTAGSASPYLSGPLTVTLVLLLPYNSLIFLQISIHTPDEESLIRGLLGSSEQVTLKSGFDPPSKISQIYWHL